jgi:DNA polymerase-3 subunit beta
MKIRVNSTEFYKALAIVNKAVSSKMTIEILRGILISAENNNLTLTSTDLEFSISTQIEVEVITPGKVLIMAEKLAKFLKLIPDTTLSIELQADHINVIADNLYLNLPNMNTDEFPEIPDLEIDYQLKVAKKAFKSLIKHTSFAASADQIRPILMGSLIKVNESQITMVALDGFRMAVKEAHCDSKLSNLKTVVSSRLLKKVSQIINDSDEFIDIAFSGKRMRIKTDKTIIDLRTIDGEFINYQEILPNDFKTIIKTDSSIMLQACKKVGMFIKDSDPSGGIDFSIKEKLLVSSQTEFGDIGFYPPAITEGEHLEVCCRKKYLMDGLKLCEGPVQINFNTSIAPVLIVNEEIGFKYLVLPIRMRRKKEVK